MIESDLKEQAIKMGLQVGKNIKIKRVKRLQGTAIKITLTGKVIELCPYVFIAEIQGKKENIKESFMYSQIITREVRLCKAKNQRKNREYF
ncbi:Veg family protein [Clostridium sp. MD294]|uniref:Veg family protein n=1 Tax=Clostridium sp. MD294 TaxID=97138 RepID=UPI0002CC1930|nr:Veg family protein [Clostridium sp. MD294]NDO46004.1 hypothetical protein [Clostridium sp. MD294]USF30332.1 hypothetical protein C820_001773 [Clostridium sp. MD294]